MRVHSSHAARERAIAMRRKRRLPIRTSDRLLARGRGNRERALVWISILTAVAVLRQDFAAGKSFSIATVMALRLNLNLLQTSSAYI